MELGRIIAQAQKLLISAPKLRLPPTALCKPPDPNFQITTLKALGKITKITKKNKKMRK